MNIILLHYIVLFQVIAEDDSKDIAEKRQVSVLARDGHLPFEGKRYVGEKQSDTKGSRSQWRDSNDDPSVFFMSKRYVGALAKTGDLRFRQQEEKREDVDTLIDELLTAEELRKIRLQALQEELIKQQEEEDGEDIEKRSLASLMRSGSLPFASNKRSIASMAKAGFLRSPYNYISSEDYDKRGISSLARNGQLPAFGKRGGISSIMRNGYSYQKRNFDSDLDSLIMDEYDIDDKRNVASLARAYNLPTTGKRNIASFARNGWIQDFGSNPKRALYEEWDDSLDETKRNLPSLLRNRVSPLVEGKRYLGAFVASNRLPYSKQKYDDSKRNMASMVRSWNTPESFRYGKRDWSDEEIENDDLVKRYVSSLLKQGPLPVSSDNLETNSEGTQNYNAEQAKEDGSENIGEEKRHLGSLLAQKSFAMRKKKSITLEDQFGDQPPTASSPQKSRSDENKMNNEIQQNHRQKREAFAEFVPVSDEYTMPVLQNTDVSEYDDGNSRANIEEQNTRKKRYFGKLLIKIFFFI